METEPDRIILPPLGPAGSAFELKVAADYEHHPEEQYDVTQQTAH
jgi:hypothetical protein